MGFQYLHEARVPRPELANSLALFVIESVFSFETMIKTHVVGFAIVKILKVVDRIAPRHLRADVSALE